MWWYSFRWESVLLFKYAHTHTAFVVFNGKSDDGKPICASFVGPIRQQRHSIIDGICDQTARARWRQRGNEMTTTAKPWSNNWNQNVQPKINYYSAGILATVQSNLFPDRHVLKLRRFRPNEILLTYVTLMWNRVEEWCVWKKIDISYTFIKMWTASVFGRTVK